MSEEETVAPGTDITDAPVEAAEEVEETPAEETPAEGEEAAEEGAEGPAEEGEEG